MSKTVLNVIFFLGVIDIHWLYLILAILFELCGTTMMKLSEGLSRMIPTVLMFVSYILCFAVFSLALKKIEVSVAYAIWSAAGIMIVSVIGVLFFKESLNLMKILSIATIIIGVVGLNLSTAHN